MTRRYWSLLGIFTFSALLLPSGARAEASPRLAKLAGLRAEAVRGPSAYAYGQLRRIWQEWDQGDPREVLTVLEDLGKEPKFSPALRAYAGLLEAYGRRRLGDLDGAKRKIAGLGYLGRWLLVGPFDNEGKGGFDRVFAPEEELEAPILLGRTYDGKEGPTKWRVSPEVSPYGWVDLGAFVRPTENGCTYATTFVRDDRPSPKARRTISLWAGSAGALRIFWNGNAVLQDSKYRSLDADRLATEVRLEDGWNRLTVKACGTEAAPLFSVRLADAEGAPDPHLQADPDPTHSDQGHREPRASMAATARKEAPKARETAAGPSYGGAVSSRIEGPLQAFERMAKQGNPALHEAFARYLVATQSDDFAEHRARDLARKAAEAGPTVPRLLLAGDLAENRNQRGLWIEKAAQHLKAHPAEATTETRLAVLLAKAGHTRVGANWREAIPVYEQALALDPENIPAVLAKAELLGEGGLRETALNFLDQALSRKPRSVALVRAMASALREQNRTTDAEEMAERYSQLRFDDPGFVRNRIELAMATRNHDAVVRWCDRLMAIAPDAAASYVFAARAYVNVGEPARAIGAYRRALDMAPQDTEVLQALADAHGLQGNRTEQLALLRKVLDLKPQEKSVREYIAHTEPSKPRPDEAYARTSTEFLAQRKDPAKGQKTRHLVDLQVTTVWPNGLASRFHQVVFQPLTEAAAAEAREYSFGFEADTETVQLRGARVYRADGQVDEAIETGEGNVDNPTISMYTSQRAFYVHFPRISAGDVVELLYRVEDIAPRNAYADYFGEVRYMQNSDAIRHAEYVLITPKSRTFYFNEPKVPGLERRVEETESDRIYRFVAKDVPGIEPESLQPPYSEILSYVHVSTYKDWNEMARWYWGLVKDQFIPDDEVRTRVADITKGLKDDAAKVRAVYNYVVQRTRYVALEFGIHGFKPYRSSQVFARGFGDCKDKATLIVTMLKELGIPSTIVILRTGHRGNFDTFPASLAPFDHAIAYVPSMNLYLDGTAEFTGSTELPSMDRGALAIQINEGNPKLVRLPDAPASDSVSERRIEATLHADGSGTLDFRAELRGVNASGWRQRYHAATQRSNRVQEDLASEFPGIEVTQVEAGDLENIEAPVTLHAKAKVPTLARRDGDSFRMGLGPKEHFVRDFASLSQRRLDLKLNANTTNIYDYTVKLPAGFKVTRLPKPAKGSTPFGAFEVTMENQGPQLRLRTTVSFTKTRITPEEYPAFRQFCESLDRALGQSVGVSK